MEKSYNCKPQKSVLEQTTFTINSMPASLPSIQWYSFTLNVPEEPLLNLNTMDKDWKKRHWAATDTLPSRKDLDHSLVSGPQATANSLISSFVSDGDGALLGSFQGLLGRLQGQNSITAQGWRNRRWVHILKEKKGPEWSIKLTVTCLHAGVLLTTNVNAGLCPAGY